MTTMRIAEVAERTGVPATTLRYYEDIGLLAPARRSGNGYRQYADRDLERLAFISRAKQLDIGLDALKELVEAWDGDDCSTVRHRMSDVVAARVAQTHARIVELVELGAQLEAAALRLADAPVQEGGCGAGCACVSDPAQVPVSVPLPQIGARAEDRPSDPPIACTLTSAAGRQRGADWRAVAARATSRSAVDGGVALLFDRDPALVEELAGLAAAELMCCGFLRFALDLSSAGIRLEVRGPAEALDIVTAMFAEPA